MVECTGPATVVFDSSLTEYSFGPSHPMSPIRVDLTMRLAEELGVTGDHLRLVDAPMADQDLIATVHTTRLIEAVERVGSAPGSVDLEMRPRHRRQPGLQGHAPRRRARRRRQRRGLPPGVERRLPAQREHHRRAAPRDGRPGERVLHLQRRGGRHPVPPRPGRRAGRLRRRRRPPRRRGRADLLGRPARAHDLPARDRPDALPRHRLPQRPGRSRRPGHARSTSRSRRARPTPAGSGPSMRSYRRCCASSGPTCWSPSTAATPTSRTRSPT